MREFTPSGVPNTSPPEKGSPGGHSTSGSLGQSVLGAFLVVGLLLAGGCDNTIEPFSEKGTYSVHGVLFSSRSDQFIRVRPLSIPVGNLDSTDLDETTVRLTNVTDGTTEILRDSILTFRDAGRTIITHNYWTDTPITPETTYRLTVEGRAGERVRATTVTPTATQAKVLPRTAKCNDLYKVIFEEVNDVRRVRARIEMKLDEAEKLPKTIRTGEWVHFPQENIFKTEEGNVVLLFTPGGLLGPLIKNFDLTTPALPDTLNPFCWGSNDCAALSARKIRVRYTYLGPEWYGSVPEDSLRYDPLTSRDVSGGLGFFGSARRDRSSTRVDTSKFIWEGGVLCDSEPPDS